MSVREEDRQKNCPSRGLGIAAAAIGVGVGAALYYLFSKRSENPDGEGSSTDWSCEQAHALDCSDDEYTTMTDTTTTDTSMHDTSYESNTESSVSETDMSTTSSISFDSSASNTSLSTSAASSPPDSPETVIRARHRIMEEIAMVAMEHLNHSVAMGITEHMNDSDRNLYNLFEFDSNGSVQNSQPLVWSIPMVREDRYDAMLEAATEDALHREQMFRDRSWKVEECSICFEGMQQNQAVMSLECTHRFHQTCILPWLRESHTCPNCRKEVFGNI